MTTDLAARYAQAEALLPHNLKKLVQHLLGETPPAYRIADIPEYLAMMMGG